MIYLVDLIYDLLCRFLRLFHFFKSFKLGMIFKVLWNYSNKNIFLPRFNQVQLLIKYFKISISFQRTT